MTATPRPVTDTAVPPTPTSASQQETPAPEETPAGPADTPTLAPTETPAGETVRFQWVRPLSTIEELEPILANVEEFEGVILAAGSEVHVDVTFDPTVTSVEELIAQFQQIGRPVELAEE